MASLSLIRMLQDVDYVTRTILPCKMEHWPSVGQRAARLVAHPLIPRRS
jgi:hypothetical protein